RGPGGVPRACGGGPVSVEEAPAQDRGHDVPTGTDLEGGADTAGAVPRVEHEPGGAVACEEVRAAVAVPVARAERHRQPAPSGGDDLGCTDSALAVAAVEPQLAAVRAR